MNQPHSLGDAHRTFPPGRLGLAPHSLHVLQNARALLSRPVRLDRLQRQALWTRRNFLANEWPTRSRTRWGHPCRARRPPRRWDLSFFGCSERSGSRTDPAGHRLRAHGDERCIHSVEYWGWRWNQVVHVVSFRFCLHITFSLLPSRLSNFVAGPETKTPPPPLLDPNCCNFYSLCIFKTSISRPSLTRFAQRPAWAASGPWSPLQGNGEL
jgi:hypothetical protein